MRLVIDLQGTQTESQHRGIGRQTRMLARAMIEHAGAHDVLVAVNEALPENLDAIRSEFATLIGPANVRTFSISGPVHEADPANLWRTRSNELAREAFLAGLKPDVVFVTSLFEGLNDNAVVSIGTLEAPYPTATTLFDLIPLYDPARYLGAPVARNFYYRRLQSLKRADLLLAISQSARREAVEMLGIAAERIELSPLAADANFRPTALSPAAERALRERYDLPERFVLYVGAIEERKNVGMIVQGFSRLPAEVQAGHALVFGGRLHPPERLQLRTMAARCGLDPAKLVFPGYIADADLPALYSLCSLFVFPSMHEGFGLPPLEAMACGAPTLAARNSSLPEVVDRADLLFGTFDADELAARMAPILTEPGFAAELREWGPRRAAAFSLDGTGRQAVASLENLHERHRASARSVAGLRARPRLAFFSPLPSDRSGIADYSVELLKELGCHYDIECIIHGTVVDDPWVLANFVLRDVDFFKRHAASYDRILYCVGNSSFHAHMFPLLETHPGVVILHDFFLSGIHDWLGNVGQASPDAFVRELYLTHGLPALSVLAEQDRAAAAERFPANRVVFHHALGTILHSRWAMEAARALYGDTIEPSLAQLPLLRAPLPSGRRAEARRRLGLGPNDVLVCSFGFVAATKLSDRLLEAWAATDAARRPGTRLAFVGDSTGGPWAEDFRAAMARENCIGVSMLGFVDEQRYEDHLHAADLAVQLRTGSRGETSRAVLDCFAAALPVIVNAHGTAVELPDDAVLKLDDAVEVADLARAIDALLADDAGRAALGRRGREHLEAVHHPGTVGLALRDAVERFHRHGPAAIHGRLLGALQEVYAPVPATDQDFTALADATTRNAPRIGSRRLFFDVTLLAASDAHTGIERVVRSMLLQLIAAPPPGYQVEPVRIVGNHPVYARAFAADRLGIPADVLPDMPLDDDAGDIYVTLEWGATVLLDILPWLQRFRRHGGRVVIGINDLLPILMPQNFPPHIGPVAERWFQGVLTVADQLVCISRTVADDVLRLATALREGSATPIAVDYYHCARDIGASLPTRGMPVQATALLASTRLRPTFLMVGTLEPRKGHAQVLDAFRSLWAGGADVALVIVGRRGWIAERTLAAIDGSPEKGRRLHWLSDISDEFLLRLYAGCTALIAASENEGFGLPLVEAAAHGLPVIVRDIPVFREVVGEGAFFFRAADGEALAAALREWMALHAAGKAPDPARIPGRSWADAAADFKQRLFADAHYGIVPAAPAPGSAVRRPGNRCGP